MRDGLAVAIAYDLSSKPQSALPNHFPFLPLMPNNFEIYEKVMGYEVIRDTNGKSTSSNKIFSG
jgi:hypothetical protein